MVLGGAVSFVGEGSRRRRVSGERDGARTHALWLAYVPLVQLVAVRVVRNAVQSGTQQSSKRRARRGQVAVGDRPVR